MTDEHRHEYIQLLDRIIAAAESGDATDIFEVYAPDAQIWHNHDDRVQTVEQNARLLTRMAEWVADRRYTDRRIHVFEGGVVQQHVLRGTHRASGEELAMNACVVALVGEDGRITRLDEYIDSAQAARFRP
ncbi:nuclear transport factor 2 family protein [Rudaeicoccus suwonensis]|uniref:Ketosteroid isomerase-like protein n=1 Tax=Rudaeicoccus suwonensis TaxID=657409 RepID=A0A561DWZ7_9MICO|nr:nuclear transport factor 2 family protein [Rudaeicoccus suwonensis]TWE07884.1 ketosteroid isomerase-like protein [Rudaeicoccus suwonensis]